jgi:CBS domain-containing protein
MRARGVMTKEVLTVDANATVQTVATLLSECGISGFRLLMRPIG